VSASDLSVHTLHALSAVWQPGSTFTCTCVHRVHLFHFSFARLQSACAAYIRSILASFFLPTCPRSRYPSSFLLCGCSLPILHTSDSTGSTSARLQTSSLHTAMKNKIVTYHKPSLSAQGIWNLSLRSTPIPGSVLRTGLFPCSDMSHRAAHPLPGVRKESLPAEPSKRMLDAE
jgi:hypothetical protein